MNPQEPNTKGLDSHLKAIKLYIYLNNKLILPVDIYPTDTLLDIRQFLSDTSQLFFISSYHFEYKRRPLSEFIEISAQKDIENKARIDIKVDSYDEKSARYHLKKVQEFIQNPYSYQNIFGSILRALKDPFLIAQELREKEEKTEAKSDENTFEYWEINQRRFGLNEIVEGSLDFFYEIANHDKAGNSQLKFVDSLTFSTFNPPPTNRKLRGEFFYLHLRTLENKDFNITSCPKGFYVNLSSQSSYNPGTQDEKVFYNLLDLICSVSPLCRRNLQKLMDEEVNEDNFYLKPLNLYLSEIKWLCSPRENDSNIYKDDQIRTENFLIDFHGFDPSTVRDWNEELQMCKDLPKQDLIQRLNKDKILLKIHSDFVEAATKGAKGIVDRFLQPLNPQDDKKQQVYVYNQIFFSLVTPTPDTYTQEKGFEASPTTTIANNDLRNLKMLHRLDVPDLYLLNTAIIDYKGQRILAQTIIPGILNCEHSQRAEFGSVDEGKTIHCSTEFNDLMKIVCDYFHLDKDVEFLDENESVVALAGSYEVKGIRSANKKKFILDLVRLSPRDANWIGTGDEYICCVVRPELVSQFIIFRNFKTASEYIKHEYTDQKERETLELYEQDKANTKHFPTNQNIGSLKSYSEKNGKEQGKKNFTYLDYINKVQEYLLRHEDDRRFRFNPNIYTRAKLAHTDSEKYKSQEKDLHELADFISSQAIPALTKDLASGDIILPCDSKSLGELFHSHGVNVRYIGQICNSTQRTAFPFLHTLLERIMLAKSMKHLLREWLFKVDSPYHTETITCILNLIFSPESLIEKLETGKIFNSNKANICPKQNGHSHKNLQGRQIGEKEGHHWFDFETILPLSLDINDKNIKNDHQKLLELKPSDVWRRVKEICKRRYLYDLPERVTDFQPFSYALTKRATLRDVCMSVGIVIECKEYKLVDDHQKKGIIHENGIKENNLLPFDQENIYDLVAIIKHLDPGCEDAKAQIELANCLVTEGKYEEALENLWGSMQIILNIYGPIHKDIAFCYSKVSNIYYRLGEMSQAIINHKQGIKILEKFYGFDNAQTAHGYFSLSLLHFHAKQYDKAFVSILKSLYIFNVIGGELHPECSVILNNLALMYQSIDKPQAAISCLFEELERNILMYGEESLKVVTSYQSLALLHLDVGDFIKAATFQRKCVTSLKNLLSPEDVRIKDSELILERINKNVEERASFYNFKQDGHKKHVDKVARAVKKVKDNECDDEKDEHDELEKAENTIKIQEKERLLQRLRTAKLYAKYGFKRPGNVDYLRLLHQQIQLGHSIDPLKKP